MNWPFNGKRSPETQQTPHDGAGKPQSNPLASPASLADQDLAIKLYEFDIRINGLEKAIVELCKHLKTHLDRIDLNTKTLDKNMHNLASMTLRPPKDLLDGGREAN